MEITAEPDVPMASAAPNPPPVTTVTQHHEALGGLEEAYGPSIWESAVSCAFFHGCCVTG